MDKVASTDSQSVVISTIVSTLGSGGLAYLLTTGNVNIIVGPKCDIQSVKCGLQGGVFLLGGALSNTLDL